MAKANELAALRRRVKDLERQLASAGSANDSAGPIRMDELLGIDQHRAVFDNFAGGMAFSKDGVILDANVGLARMLGATVDALIGKPIVDIVAPEDRELVRKNVSAGVTTPYVHRLLRADGATLPVEATASMIMVNDKPLRFTVIRDISDRVAAEDALARERNLLSVILDKMPAGVFAVSVPSGRPVLVNEFNRRLLRKAEIPNVAKEQISETYAAYVAGTDQLYPTERLPIVRAMSGEVSSIDDIELRFDDGTRTQVRVIGAPIYNSAGEIFMAVAIAEDITARKRAEERLHDEQEFLRAMLKAHERDRQLLAYEVHDGLVQYITAAAWHVESVVENEELSLPVRKTLVDSLGLLRTAISDARHVLSGLRPPVLDERGIVTALEYLVAENSTPDGLQVCFLPNVFFRRLDPLLEGTIFRMVQESLNNVRKHSGATAANVLLVESGDRLRLTIEDNGHGFDTAKVARDRFGLQGISKRAELLGGTAEIESEPGQGTRIVVDLPLILATGASR